MTATRWTATAAAIGIGVALAATGFKLTALESELKAAGTELESACPGS